MRDVIAASSELPAASGTNSALAAGRGALGATAAKGAGASGNGFGSVLDGYMGDDSAPGGSAAPKRQASGERHQNDGLAAPASSPVQAATADPLGLRWSLEYPVNPGAITAAADTQNLASSSGSAPDSAEPPQPAGPLACDPAARGAAQALGATPELAFGARLLPLEPPVPSTGGADPEDRSTPTDGGRNQNKNAEISGSGAGAHTATLDDWQSESQNASGSGSGGDSSRTREDGRGNSTAEPRNADVFAGTAAKATASSGDRALGDRGNTGQTEIESAWNSSAPALPDGDEHSAAAAPETSQTGPAVGEPPEPPSQPASHDVSLHLADGDSSVDIRMAERAGEIRVTVHTPDRDLASSLRADLPDLVGSLRQSGFHAEAWRPAAAAETDTGRRNGSEGSPSEEHSPGGRRERRQQHSQQQQPKDQPRWAGAWKSSLDPAQESHT
jgi:hypothetical protein